MRNVPTRHFHMTNEVIEFQKDLILSEMTG